jgi:TonB family protein
MKNKIKIMKSREQVTDQEIHDYMDFDKLLIEKNRLIRRRNMRMLGNAGIVIILATGIFLYFYNTASEQPKSSVEKDKIAEVQQLRPVQKTDSVLANTDETSKVNSGLVRKPEIIEKSTGVVEKKSIVKENKSADAIYVQAEPVNGYPDLYAYFDRELVYPAEAIKDSIQGDVTVVFSIDTTGKAQEIQIENSLGKPFDKEVLRLMVNMPLWKPASFNGKYVNSKVSLPLTFELKKVPTKN